MIMRGEQHRTDEESTRSAESTDVVSLSRHGVVSVKRFAWLCELVRHSAQLARYDARCTPLRSTAKQSHLMHLTAAPVQSSFSPQPATRRRSYHPADLGRLRRFQAGSTQSRSSSPPDHNCIPPSERHHTGPSISAPNEAAVASALVRMVPIAFAPCCSRLRIVCNRSSRLGPPVLSTTSLAFPPSSVFIAYTGSCPSLQPSFHLEY